VPDSDLSRVRSDQGVCGACGDVVETGPRQPGTWPPTVRCAVCLPTLRDAEERAAKTPIRRLDVPPKPFAEGSTRPPPGLYLRHSPSSWADAHEAAMVAATRLNLGHDAVPTLLDGRVDVRWTAWQRHPEQAPTRPWGHLSRDDLATARRAYADALQWRMLASAPPVRIAAPDVACLLCGVAAVEVSARAEHRRRVEGEESWWQPTTVTVGRRRIDGHVCEGCADLTAVAGSVHAALVTMLRRHYEGLPADQEPADASSLAWCAESRDANATPWQHWPARLDVHDGDHRRVAHRRVAAGR
jgi:hypothetical protein